MKTKLFLFNLLLVSLVSATPSKTEVLAAIDSLSTSISDFEKHASTITIFATKSEEVELELSYDRIPWMDEENTKEVKHEIYLALYLAGMIKHQLETESKDDNPYYGWMFILPSYESVFRDAGYQSDALDKLLTLHNKGELKKFADKVLNKPKA